MKKEIAITILSFLLAVCILITTAVCIYSSEQDRAIEFMKEEINSLQAELEKPVTFQRVKVKNDFWEQSNSRNALYGTITFDNLEIVESIEVSYIDSVFNKVSLEENTITLDYTQNKAVTFCICDEIPHACELEISYVDGRSETILIKISWG